MPNPIFNALNQNQSNNMAQSFQQFMQSMKGQNPQAIINQMVSSGRISQAQLDQAQKQVQQIKGALDGMRGMFGF